MVTFMLQLALPLVTRSSYISVKPAKQLMRAAASSIHFSGYASGRLRMCSMSKSLSGQLNCSSCFGGVQIVHGSYEQQCERRLMLSSSPGLTRHLIYRLPPPLPHGWQAGAYRLMPCDHEIAELSSAARMQYQAHGPPGRMHPEAPGLQSYVQLGGLNARRMLLPGVADPFQPAVYEIFRPCMYSLHQSLIMQTSQYFA